MDLTCWMKNIDDLTPISLINIPGTHDSATQFIPMAKSFRCQDTGIKTQLENGARFIDIRLERKFDKFNLVHSVADCRTSDDKNSTVLYFEQVLKDMTEFVKRNKTETILVSVKMDDGMNQKRFFDFFYKKYLEHNDRWFTKNEIPNLSQCRGKLVFIRRCKLHKKKKIYTDNNTGLNFAYWIDQKSTTSSQPLKCEFYRQDGESNKDFAIIQDRYGFSGKSKWEKAILPTLENYAPTENQILINWLSTAGGCSPLANAQYINDKFINYSLITGKKYGIINSDFYNKEIGEKIIITNF